MATKLLKLMNDHITGLKETSKVINQIPNTRVIEYANGYWLHMLNILIGGISRPSNTYSDNELRIRMRHKILMNNGCGTIESIITASRYYLYLDNNNTWDSIKNKDLNVYTNGQYVVIEASGQYIKSKDKIKEIQNFVAVGFGILIVEIFGNNTFTFYSGSGSLIDPNKGFSEVMRPYIGGKLANIISSNSTDPT